MQVKVKFMQMLIADSAAKGKNTIWYNVYG